MNFLQASKVLKSDDLKAYSCNIEGLISACLIRDGPKLKPLQTQLSWFSFLAPSNVLSGPLYSIAF